MAMSNEYPDIVPISLETTESLLGYIFVDDSNVISSFASLKATQTSPSQGHSRSRNKVIGKPTRYSVGLSSKMFRRYGDQKF